MTEVLKDDNLKLGQSKDRDGRPAQWQASAQSPSTCSAASASRFLSITRVEPQPSKNIEILKYSYTRTQKDRFSMPLILSAREEKTIQQDLFFEITNGRVSRYWQEGQTRKTESCVD